MIFSQVYCYGELSPQEQYLKQQSKYQINRHLFYEKLFFHKFDTHVEIIDYRKLMPFFDPMSPYQDNQRNYQYKMEQREWYKLYLNRQNENNERNYYRKRELEYQKKHNK